MNLKRIISIGCFANVAEWYDFSIYAFLAGTIGQLFFNSSSPKLALIKAFFLFTASYLIRPLGSFFWGYYGDRHGRKVTLRWSLMLMAIPTILIGLLPTNSSINIISAGCIIMLRLVQGFAAGGELPITACYVYEISPLNRKNFFCSIVTASSMFGALLGSAVSSLTYYFFSPQEILAYAWRIPFLLGFIVLLVIMYIRKDIEETDDFKMLANKSEPRVSLKNWFCEQHLGDCKPLLGTMALYVFIQSAFYLLFVWLPQYMNIFLSIDKNIAFAANTIGMSLLVVLTLIFGYFTRKNYRLIALASIVSMMIVCIPLFLLLHTKNFVLILLSYAVFALSLSGMYGVIINIIGRTFKPVNRCSGISIGSTIPTAIFGGGIPTLCSYLLYNSGNNLLPAILLALICLMVLPVVIKSNILS